MTQEAQVTQEALACPRPAARGTSSSGLKPFCSVPKRGGFRPPNRRSSNWGLEAATAEILAGALRRAETARHRELAAAIASVVVAAIRAGVHNSRDMMVEALYPITGRLVAAAVANAFRDLLDTINQRIDYLVSPTQGRMRLRALATGRWVAQIALAEARASGYRRILLLERGSGRLLAMGRPGGEREDNPELVSGIVAAIAEFAASVLSEQHGQLRSLDLGASQVHLRASSQIILAANRKTQNRLDAGFVDLVARRERGAEVGESDLADLAETTAPPGARARASAHGHAGACRLACAGLCAEGAGLSLAQGAADRRGLRRGAEGGPRAGVLRKPSWTP